MGWQFWQRESGPGPVDAKLHDLIMSRFNLSTVEIDRLSVLRRAGNFAGRPVTRLRVYDPSLLSGDADDVRTYRHLDAQAQAVCFEGHTERGRAVDLSARGCLEESVKAA